MAIEWNKHNVTNIHFDFAEDGSNVSEVLNKIGYIGSTGNITMGKTSLPVWTFNAVTKTDIRKTKNCLSLNNVVVWLDFSKYDLELNDVYLKFYRLMPNWAGGSINGPRFMYAKDGGNDTQQPEILQFTIGFIDDDTIGVRVALPNGEYSYKGWEICIVNKTEITSNKVYRVNDEDFFGACKLVTPTEVAFQNNSVKIDETYTSDFDSVKQYSIPYFNFKGKAIKGIGYYGPADVEQNNYTTTKQITPFNSNKTDKFNFMGEPELVYNSIQIDRTGYDLVTLNLANKILTVNGNTYTLGDNDEVCVYKFPLEWEKTKQTQYILNTSWTRTSGEADTGKTKISTYRAETDYAGVRWLYLEPPTSSVVSEDQWKSRNSLQIYRIGSNGSCNVQLMSDGTFDSSAFTDVSSQKRYSNHIFEYKTYKYSTTFTSEYLFSNNANNYLCVGKYDTKTELSPGYIKTITLTNVPCFAPDKNKWTDGSFITISNLTPQASIEYADGAYVFNASIKKVASNVMVPPAYVISDNYNYHATSSSYVDQVTTNIKVGLDTNGYDDTGSTKYFYAVVIFRS